MSFCAHWHVVYSQEHIVKDFSENFHTSTRKNSVKFEKAVAMFKQFLR